MRSPRSKTVTRCPALLSWAAAHRPAGPEPTTATRLPVRVSGGSGTIQPSSPALVHDGALDVLDRDRRRADAQHASPLAGCGADAACEFGEIVGLMQSVQRLAPQAPVDQVVPFGDQVVDRTARRHAVEQCPGVAEGDAAVHAARALFPQLLLAQVQVELFPVPDAVGSPSRSRGSSRRYSIKPVGFPICVSLVCLIICRGATKRAQEFELAPRPPAPCCAHSLQRRPAELLRRSGRMPRRAQWPPASVCSRAGSP